MELFSECMEVVKPEISQVTLVLFIDYLRVFDLIITIRVILIINGSSEIHILSGDNLLSGGDVECTRPGNIHE